jgi:hypothetical protein
MRTATTGAPSILATLGLSALCAAWSTACGGSADSMGDQPEAGADTVASVGQCPATVALTVGAACSDEGLLCGPEYTCDLTDVPLLCVCTAGVFACTDATGKAIVAGETPACPRDTEPVCPPDEESAMSASCDDIGLLCDYPSACVGGVDSCQCIGAGSSPAFQCEPAPCPGAEAGMVAADGGADVEREGGGEDAGSGGDTDATVTEDAGEDAAATAVADSGSGVADAVHDADAGPGLDATLGAESSPAADASAGDEPVDSAAFPDLDAGPGDG